MRAGTVGAVSTYDSAVAVCTLGRPLMARVGDTAWVIPMLFITADFPLLPAPIAWSPSEMIWARRRL